MYVVRVLDGKGELIESRRFRTFEETADYSSDVVGCLFEAHTIHISDGHNSSVIDCWQLRDRAVIDGYELPVHKTLLERSGRV